MHTQVVREYFRFSTYATARRRRGIAVVGGVVALVLGVHALLLFGWPIAALSMRSPESETAVQAAFITRSLVLDAPSANPSSATPPQHPPKAAQQVRKALPVAPENLPDTTAEAAQVTSDSSEGTTQQPEVNNAPSEQPAANAVSADSPVPETAAGARPVQRYEYPASARLKYDVQGLAKGFNYTVNGELLWQQDGQTYEARLEISHFLFGYRIQTSKGALGSDGLAPVRFGDKTRGGELAAHFQREKNIISFSANTPDAPLTPVAQDQLSVLMQIGAMLAAEPSRFVPSSQWTFEAAGPRSVETWTFTTGPAEELQLPGGRVHALKFTREPSAQYDTKVELWLALEQAYLPVHIKITQSNGDYAEMLWRSTQNP